VHLCAIGNKVVVHYFYLCASTNETHQAQLCLLVEMATDLNNDIVTSFTDRFWYYALGNQRGLSFLAHSAFALPNIDFSKQNRSKLSASG